MTVIGGDTAGPGAPVRPGTPAGGRRFRRPALLLLLAVLFAVFVVESYYPFAWDPPRTVTNQVTRTADGGMRFGDRNRAATATTPAWLADAQRTQQLTVILDVRPAFPQRYPEASIVMLARDYWHGDLAIGQDGRNLLVWLLRPGSDVSGDPPYVVDDAFTPGRATAVVVAIRGRDLRIGVDGRTSVRERLPAGTLRDWPEGVVAFGDEVHGGTPWQGTVTRAEVRTPGRTVDYLRPGALDVPTRYFYLPDHVSPFPPTSDLEWVALVLHLLSFLPVGFLLVACRRRPLRVPVAVLLAMAGALLLAAGKFGFADRHTAVADLVVQAVAATVGAYVARAVLRRRAPTAS